MHIPSLHRSDQNVSSTSESGFLGLWEQGANAQGYNSASNPSVKPQPSQEQSLRVSPNLTEAPVNVSAGVNSSRALSNWYNSSSSSSSSSLQNDSAWLQSATNRSGDQKQHADASSVARTLISDTDMHAGNSGLDLSSGLANATFSNRSALSMAAHALNQSSAGANSTLSSGSSAETSSAPDIESCPPYLELPVPGMDIALANESKCYPHPATYKNENYLNDDLYMLYHHDDILPHPEPHPAFTWGDISRFTHAMHKMKRNDPVKAIFVGGSVSTSYCRSD